MSFRTRLFIGFLLISTIPLAIVGFLSYLISNNIYKNQTIDNMTRIANDNLVNINVLFKTMTDVLLEIVSSQELHNYLKNASIDEEQAKEMDKMVENLNIRLFTIYSLKRDAILGINILPASGRHPIRGAYSDKTWAFTYGYENAEIYKKACELMGKHLWIFGENRSYNVDERHNINPQLHNVVLGSAVMDLVTYNILGVVNIYIDYEYIQNLIDNKIADSGEYTFILTEDEKIVLHPVRELIGEKFDAVDLLNDIEKQRNGYDLYDINNEKYLVSYVTSDINGWRIVNIYPYSNVVDKSFAITKVIIYIALLSILLALAISLAFSLSIYKPINELSLAMRTVGKGKLDIKIDENRKDEFGMLARNFNYLTGKVTELIDEVKQEQIANKEAEINLLRAQINPHFLYNTLNIVDCLANSGETAHIHQVITGLIQLLRVSVGSVQEIIQIREEIKYIQSYIAIQKLRLDVVFDVEYSLDPAIMDYGIPKLTLQPIVENAIIHGFEKSKDMNLIRINGYISGKDIVLEVLDNGKGMDIRKVDEIEQALKSDKKGKFSKIGMNNVNDRIKLLYGSKYGLAVSSIPGVNTKIQIIIPAKHISEFK